jgi:hypothetical protein
VTQDPASESEDIVKIDLPQDLLANARAACAEGESLHDFILAAVERETERRQGLAAYEEILRVRAQILAETGRQPDSGPMIRALRDG